MRIEVEGTVEGTASRLVWQDGWFAGTLTALRRLALVADVDNLDLADEEEFLLAVVRSFDRDQVRVKPVTS